MTETQRPIDPNEALYASVLWEFLAPHAAPEPADAVFVFGGVNLRVPEQAAALYTSGYAPTVLVSGGTGSRTHLHFDGPEVDVFVQVLEKRGVPSGALITEPAASNTGENVQFGMAKLLSQMPEVSSVLLVSTPFIMRRCLATFEQQYPRVRTTPCPPEGGYKHFIDRPHGEFIDRLVAELDRLDAYTTHGYIAPVEVPAAVRAAADYLRNKSTQASST